MTAILTASTPWFWLMVLSSALFAVGAAGVLLKRHSVAALIALNVMFVAVILGLASVAMRGAAMAGQTAATSHTAHVFMVVVVAVAAACTAVGLGLVVALARTKESADVDCVNTLRW